MKKRSRDHLLVVGEMKKKQEVRDYLNTPKGRQYIAQIEQMIHDARAWLVNNPGTNPIITFEVPPGVMLITDVKASIQHGYLRVDKMGQRMLDELGWTADTRSQPSFRMIQMAIEIAFRA